MAKDSTTTLNEDSLAYLEESKKGKTRKFAMICKGVNRKHLAKAQSSQSLTGNPLRALRLGGRLFGSELLQ